MEMREVLDRAGWIVVALYAFSALIAGGSQPAPNCATGYMPWFIAACLLALLGAGVAAMDVRAVSRSRPVRMRALLRLGLYLTGCILTCLAFRNF